MGNKAVRVKQLVRQENPKTFNTTELYKRFSPTRLLASFFLYEALSRIPKSIHKSCAQNIQLDESFRLMHRKTHAVAGRSCRSTGVF